VIPVTRFYSFSTLRIPYLLKLRLQSWEIYFCVVSRFLDHTTILFTLLPKWESYAAVWSAFSARAGLFITFLLDCFSCVKRWLSFFRIYCPSIYVQCIVYEHWKCPLLSPITMLLVNLTMQESADDWQCNCRTLHFVSLKWMTACDVYASKSVWQTRGLYCKFCSASEWLNMALVFSSRLFPVILFACGHPHCLWSTESLGQHDSTPFTYGYRCLSTFRNA